jgi:hypothetical protein
VFGPGTDVLRNRKWRFLKRDKWFKELEIAFLDKGQMAQGIGHDNCGQGTDGLRNWIWRFRARDRWFKELVTIFGQGTDGLRNWKWRFWTKDI